MNTLKQYEDEQTELTSGKVSFSDWFLGKVVFLTIPACLLLAWDVSETVGGTFIVFIGAAVGSYLFLLAVPAFLSAFFASPALLFKKKFKPVFTTLFTIFWVLSLAAAIVSQCRLARLR